MIRTLENDVGLADGVRARATRLKGFARRSPELACARLIALSVEVSVSLPRSSPTEDLAKCTGIEDYYEHYLDPDVRGFFRTAEDYRRHVEDADQPGDVLLADTRSEDPLIPAIHSWFAPMAAIAGLNGEETRQALAITYRPPLVTLIFGRKSMRKAAVTVRPPRAVDAVPKRLRAWDPRGLPGGRAEFIDGNVPGTALDRIEWRS